MLTNPQTSTMITRDGMVLPVAAKQRAQAKSTLRDIADDNNALHCVQHQRHFHKPNR
jgi:hypothetical protein